MIVDSPNTLSNTLLSIEISFKTLINSQKWIIYLVLSLIPFGFQIFTIIPNILNSQPITNISNPSVELVDFFINFHITIIFTIGALLIVLPISADELSDNTMDLYIIRPVSRYVLYFGRWVSAQLMFIALNIGIILFYFLFYHIDFPDKIIQDSPLILDMIIIVILGSLIYTSLFLMIGFYKNKGFSLGIFIALIEIFLLNLIFLANDVSMPKTHIKLIANELFGSDFTYSIANAPDLLFSVLYMVGGGIIFLILHFSGLSIVRR